MRNEYDANRLCHSRLLPLRGLYIAVPEGLTYSQPKTAIVAPSTTRSPMPYRIPPHNPYYTKSRSTTNFMNTTDIIVVLESIVGIFELAFHDKLESRAMRYGLIHPSCRCV